MAIIDFRMRPRTKFFFRNLTPSVIPAYKTYVEIFHIRPRIWLSSLEEFVAEMTANEITHGVIFAGTAEGNRHVYEACRKFPDVFYGLAGIDITQGISQGVADLRLAYHEYGLRGFTLSSFMTGIPADDPRYYPLYAESEAAGRLVQIHAAAHFNRDYPFDISHPLRVDTVARHFPELTMVMCHAGYGFGVESISVVLRHPKMYVDFTGLHPKALSPEFIHAINGPLRKRAIFGTNFPCLEFDIVSEWKKVVHDNNYADFFHNNAARALGIEG